MARVAAAGSGAGGDREEAKIRFSRRGSGDAARDHIVVPGDGAASGGAENTSASAGQTEDDLKRIKGVGTYGEQQLKKRGITRFSQIAAWQKDDIDKISDYLGFSGRIDREDWIGQAAILARGGIPKFEHRVLPHKADEEVSGSLAPQGQGAVGGDNLKRIKGIGALVEQKLQGLGITSFSQIAAWTNEDISRINEALSFSGRIEREDWIGQAEMLAKGESTDFARRFDAGEVDSSKS